MQPFIGGKGSGGNATVGVNNWGTANNGVNRKKSPLVHTATTTYGRKNASGNFFNQGGSRGGTSATGGPSKSQMRSFNTNEVEDYV